MTPGTKLRNQTNAQFSTGPKSIEGKARASQNARTHGSTAKPDVSEVTKWLKVILNKETLTEDDLRPISYAKKCALELATAEARLAMTEQSRRDRGEQDWHAKQKGTLLKEMTEALHTLFDDPLKGEDPNAHDPEMVEAILSNAGERLAQAVTAFEAKQHRLTWRYQREAHANRRRALKKWGRALKEEYKFSQRCSKLRWR